MSNKLIRNTLPSQSVNNFEGGTLVTYGESAQNVYIVLCFSSNSSGIGAVNIVTGGFLSPTALVTALPKGEVLEITVGD